MQAAVAAAAAEAGRMSQARVTDFFSQRKKNATGPARAAKQRVGAAVGHGSSRTNTRSVRSKNKDDLRCTASVREEFVRVIDEAAGFNDGESGAHSSPEGKLSSPRTPKRSSADAEFDLGAAVFSATLDHSTAKKKRQAESVNEVKVDIPVKPTRKSARKKLVLQDETQQALRKEDIASLESRVQETERHAEESTSAASSAPIQTSSSPAARAAPHTSHPKALVFSISRAKELAAKAQRRKEEREAAERKQTETQTEDSTEQPAYQRYHNLAQATPPGLSLPYQYKVLAEKFRSMDTVVAMLYNRCETATFTKIKRGVQDMMHKQFEEKCVGQIKTVFPEAYIFRQEKNIPTFNSSIKKGSYQLTVDPIIPCDQNEARPVMSASRLLERRHTFHSNLISIVKRHHKVFLSLLDPPVSVPEDKLTRWHPRFNVDTVPAVEPSSLPQAPHTDKLATAQEVLDKARSLITPKMEKALVALAQKTESKATESEGPTSPQNPAAPQTSAPAAPPVTQVPTALKGVPQSLLDRIRSKEAQKLQAAMTRNPAQDERLLMMSRLGELARILRSVFVAEKKPALIMEVACNRMVASYRSALSTGEMEKHIHLLAEVAADWLTIHPIRKDMYLKLNKNMELSTVLNKLSHRLREEERL
ncbi:DNA replication factor Cdt1 [Mugil cephalus]|uniref:DNA replication factor Cdt1 n=1 Tax=Mugil cephalus TaxID=48193 RepID=UPI001FB57F61|nr:DNA replication factor Cdt1 [Mugil cephalus]